jgi:hypothetical protein
LIESFRIFPGEHCGSVAMRGLLNHYCGLELPEPAVFGLGAGIECCYLESPAMQPAVSVFGRTLSLEADLGQILQVDYREQPEADDEQAWQVVREEVLAGRPTMLSGDILYLDYREYKVHFPGMLRPWRSSARQSACSGSTGKCRVPRGSGPTPGL